MKKILVVGSLNADVVLNVKKLPARGETIFVSDVSVFPGGKGANQGVAASRLGAEVDFVGCVGDDDHGKLLLNSLTSEGIGTANITVDPRQPTGSAYITVEDGGENMICVHSGANFQLDTELVKGTELSKDYGAVVASLEVPVESVALMLKRARQQNIITVLNPAPAVELSDQILADTDYLIPNETELATLTNMKVESLEEVKQAASMLLAKGVGAVVVTLGSKGAYYLSSKLGFHIPSVPVKMVDATAAGDSFVAAFTKALVNQESPQAAGEFAAKVGALTVTKLGAQSSLPTLAEVERFIAKG